MRNSLEVFFHFRLGLAHFSQQVICLLEMCENSYLKRFCWKKRQKELGKFCHWCVKKIFHTAKTTNKFFLTTKEWNTFQHSTYPVENDNWKFQLLFVAQAKCVRKKNISAAAESVNYNMETPPDQLKLGGWVNGKDAL